MSVLQEVVQQLENILKTSNQYGPFVCLDAPPPVSILSFDANSDGIQKKRETSQELLQCDSDPLISQGLGLDQPNDDDVVILVQSDGEDLVGSVHSDNGLNLLDDDEHSSCHGIGGTTQIEEERKGARVATEMLERLPKVLNSQGSDSISSDLLQQETLALQVQEGGTVTADSPVPSTCAVNPLSTIEQLSLNDPLLQTSSESNVQVAKDRIDGEDENGKVDLGVAPVQLPKRKGGRRKRAVDPRSNVPKIKRPVGRPRKPIDPSAVPKIKRPRGRPRKCPAANVTIDAVSVPTDATDHSSTLSKGQDLSGKDVFTKDSSHTEEVSLVRQTLEKQHEFQNPIDGSTSATPTGSLSNKDCNAPVPTGYLRTDTPLTMPRKELNVETNVSDVLNNHNGIGLSFHLGGEKEEVKTAPAIFSVLGLQECDRSSIGKVFNQEASAVQVQVQEVETVNKDSIIPFTGEVNCHNIVEQLSPTDVPDKLHNYHDMGGICSAAEKDTPGTAFENGKVHSSRTREQPAADTLLQNSSESILQVEKDKVEERNLEGEETNGDKAYQPTKRKRGRPKRSVDPRSIVPKIKRPVGRPRSIVPKIKRPVGRPRSIVPKIKRPVVRSRKKPATNVEKDGVSAPMDQMGDCCSLPCAIGIQNSNRDLNITKDVLDDCPINPTCTVSTNGDTEKGQESSYGGPIRHSFSKVNNDKILENETYEGKQEMCRQEQNDSSLWEKETTAVKSAKRTALSEQKVPKLKLRRKRGPKVREEVFDPPGCLRTRQSTSPGSRSPVSGRFLKQKIDKVGTLIPSSLPPPGPITTDTSVTLLNTSKTTYEVSNSLERDDTSGNDHSDLPNEIELNGKVPHMVQDQLCPAVTESQVEMANHPSNHQSQTQETLPKDELNGKVPNEVQDQLCPALAESEVEMANQSHNQLAQTQETLPKGVLSLKRSRGRPRQRPDHHEKLPNVCPASGIGSAANEVTSTKDESKKACVSKDTCETPKKRGRGRPRKNRPAEEAVHNVEMKNRAPPDNRPSSIPDDKVHENTDTRLGLKSNVTKSLDDSKLLETSFPSALNGLALGKLSGKDMREGLNQETEVMKMESKSASRIPQKPVAVEVQRVIPIVCSSETEMNYSKMFKQNRNQVTALTHSRRITSDADSCSKGLPLQQDRHRSMLLQNGCTKKSSVRIKKLPRTLITGSLNLDDTSRLAQLFQHPEKHALNMEKKGKDIRTHSMSWNTHHLSAVKSTTPLSSGGRVITPYAPGHVQSYLPTSPQKTIKLNYGDQNAQSMQASVGNEKCLPPPKKVMKYLPIPNSVKTEKGKTLILDRIKKNAAMLRGNCFQNKEIQKKFKARQASLIAKAKSNNVKRGRGRPPKKLVSFGNSVNQKIDEYQPRGPLLISKHLFRSKQKAVKDVTLSQNQLNSALAPEKCVHKRRGRLPVKHDESSKSIPNVAGPVGTDGHGELRKKLGRLFEKSIASHNNRNKKEIPNAASVTKRRKVGRPRKNPSPSVVHVPLKNCTSVNDVRRKPGRPRKIPRPADAVEPEKKTGDAPGCNEVERPMGSFTCGENSQPVKRKVGRPRKKPVIEYIDASPFESLHSQSPVKAVTRKRGRPRKRPSEEIRPKYPSVPLPITDNFLFRGLGFQPSTFDGFIETPSCDFTMPIEEAVETLEETPLPEATLTKNDGDSTQADTDIVPGCSVGAVEQSFVIEQSEIDFMNNGQWILQQPTKDTELPERSCCISVTTGPVVPPPPSLNIELDDTSLPDTSRNQSTDEAISIPARDVLDSCVNQPEEEMRAPDVQELLAETAPITIID